MNRRFFVFVAKVAISALMVLWLSTGQDWSKISQSFSNANLLKLLLVLILARIVDLLPIVRWKILLATQGISIGFWSLLVLSLKSRFLSTFMPLNGAHDVIRTLMVHQNLKASFSALTFVGVIDRVFGFSGILTVLGLGLLIFGSKGGFLQTLSPEVLGGSLILIFSFLLLLGPALRKLLNKKKEWIKILPLSFSSMSWGVGLSAIYQSLLGVVVFGLFQSLELSFQVSVQTFILYVPLIAFVAALPVSYKGLGVREAGFTYLFVSLNQPASVGLVLGGLASLNTLFASLVGGVLFIKWNALVRRFFLGVSVPDGYRK